MNYDFISNSVREGMFLKAGDGISCSLPGSAVSIRFYGQEVTISVKDLSETGKSWVNVFIDDLPVRVFRVDPENEEYLIADDLPMGEHTLTLQKRTEAVFGTILFKSFTIPNGKILPPPKPRQKHLLLIGDSITCGFGNEADIPSDVDASRENFAITYGYLTARMLDADILACAASGTGLYQNFAGGKVGRMSDFFMGEFCKMLDECAIDPFMPDAAVINLGTNDWSAPIRPEDYTARYTEMVEFFRERYPNVPLICAIGPMNMEPSKIVADFVACHREKGDINTHFLEFPIICREKDGFGGAGHPFPKKHQEMAAVLSQALRRLVPVFFNKT